MPIGIAGDIVALIGRLDGGEIAIEITLIPAILADVEDLARLVGRLCIADKLIGVHRIKVSIFNIDGTHRERVVALQTELRAKGDKMIGVLALDIAGVGVDPASRSIVEFMIRAAGYPSGRGLCQWPLPYQFDLTLAAVRSRSLISRHVERRTLSVHRLVQAVLRDQMTAEETAMWGERVTRMLHAAFPPVAFDTWSQCERFVPHVLACLPVFEQAEGARAEAGEVLFRAGSYLLRRGRLTEAEPLLARAVALEERQAGTDARALLERLEKQAVLYRGQGKYVLTEETLQRVIELEEQVVGVEHPRRAETLNNLGDL